MDYCPFDIEPDPSMFDLETVRVGTSYGELAARVTRERDGEMATVYIHGIGADWSNWTPILQAEAAACLQVHDRVLIDLPGFGDSPLRPGIKIAEVSEAILEMVHGLGYEKVRIVGHSLGGFQALDMASRYPDQIDSIHIVAGSYFSMLQSNQHPIESFFQDPVIATIFNIYFQAARTGNLAAQLARTFYKLGIARAFVGAVASHPLRLRRSVVRALSYQYNAAGIVHTAQNQVGYEAEQLWTQIRCPIWAVFADRDRLVPPRDMERLIRCQPTVKSVMLLDSSHLMHIERPFRVLEALALWNKTA